jgi:glutamate/tyrosine decarboxylase-like PLP-dependent enzyme
MSNNLTLDPTDWEAFRELLHRVADACIDQLKNVRSLPWSPVDEAWIQQIALGDAQEGVGEEQTALLLIQSVIARHSGNIHPKFFGWVQGSGNAMGLIAELVAATMNSNCGGRDHGAVYIEREVVRWCADCFGFPRSASGVLVGGTSQATILALAAARVWALGGEVRSRGSNPGLRVYASHAVHNAVVKAAELIGLGAASVRLVRCDASERMDPQALSMQIRADRGDGLIPFCVVGTAGSVNRGASDPLLEIARVCTEENLWFHVDGAFGAWARIGGEPWCELVQGIEEAHSIALDFHKWMFVQYDCGLLLMRDEKTHRAAFACRPAYLAAQTAGLGGGEPWYCDFGTDLSRSFRALKVWATLKAYGRRKLGEIIAHNCALAARLGGHIAGSASFQVVAPVCLNVCCFSVADSDDQTASGINAAIAVALQLSGEGVFSTTSMNGRTVLRAAITNHRTNFADIDAVFCALEKEVSRQRSG